MKREEAGEMKGSGVKVQPFGGKAGDGDWMKAWNDRGPSSVLDG